MQIPLTFQLTSVGVFSLFYHSEIEAEVKQLCRVTQPLEGHKHLFLDS